MQRIDFRKLYDLRRLMFLHKLASFQHNVISHLLSLHLASDDVLELYCTYDITISSKPSLIKRSVIAMFENYATFDDLLGQADTRLFRKIVANDKHVLRQLMQPQTTASQNYSLRERLHQFQLPERSGRLTHSATYVR